MLMLLPLLFSSICSGFAAPENINPVGECELEIEHDFYSFCYSEEHKISLWTAHTLTVEFAHGKVKRTNDFREDPHIKSPVGPLDYLDSGYDRGHLVPAADMKLSKESMSSTFFMTNITPQNPGFNRGIWRALESKIRYWIHDFGEGQIITGSIVSNNPKTIDSGVAVPDFFYKIIYFPESKTMRAFLIPNKFFPEEILIDEFSVSVDDLEQLTNFDFFSYLPDNLEIKLEASK